MPVGGQSGTLARRHSGRLQRGPAAVPTATLAAMVPVSLRIPGVVNISGKNVSMAGDMSDFLPWPVAPECEDGKCEGRRIWLET